MGVQTQEKKLTLADGSEVTLMVTQLPAMKAVKLFTRLTGIVGPMLSTLGPALAAMKPGAVKLQGNVPALLSAAAKELFAKLTEEEMERLIKDLLAPAVILDGKTTTPFLNTMDSTFAGDMGSLLAAVAFALEVNYGSFLGGSGALAKLRSLAESPSPESSTSSGPSSG